MMPSLVKLPAIVACLSLGFTAEAFCTHHSSAAFYPPARRVACNTQLYSTAPTASGKTAKDVAAEIEKEDMAAESGKLPTLKNNLYDEDEKFKDDPDWITENVPGKVVLNDIELAAQVTALSKLEEKWRKERLNKEYEDARILGFTTRAETYNGRFAMFFLVVGLLTELWTGITIPGQVEEMLRIIGILGYE